MIDADGSAYEAEDRLQGVISEGYRERNWRHGRDLGQLSERCRTRSGPCYVSQKQLMMEIVAEYHGIQQNPITSTYVNQVYTDQFSNEILDHHLGAFRSCHCFMNKWWLCGVTFTLLIFFTAVRSVSWSPQNGFGLEAFLSRVATRTP